MLQEETRKWFCHEFASKETSVNSQSFSGIELPAMASASVESVTKDMENKLMRPNGVKLEAFAVVRLAWGFASAVFLLMMVSLLLVVAGYAGSSFASDLQPQTVSSPTGR